jgi:hypothetical protein
VTPSSVDSPFAERLERSRVLRPPLALGCLRAELLRRVADPPLDERPLDRLFDARAFDPDLEEPDAPRRWDVLVWAMFPHFAGNPSLISYPCEIVVIRPPAVQNGFH